MVSEIIHTYIRICIHTYTFTTPSREPETKKLKPLGFFEAASPLIRLLCCGDEAKRGTLNPPRSVGW